MPLTFFQPSQVDSTFNGYLRNRIINGAMMIDQRNAGASVTPANAAYTLDRWSALLTQSSKFSIQQNGGGVTPPTGFINYLGVTSLSSYSVVTGDIFGVRQRVEGLNVSDFAWGTASAQAVTLSFWVRSSLTGTFGGAVQNSAGNRSYPFSYVINGSNTWEYKTVTIPGDTTGTWLTTNGVGLELNFGLGGGATYSGTAGAWAAANYGTATGATSVVGTNGATFYLTGVQLEVGTVATPFERRMYGQELQLAQRYYQYWGGGTNQFQLRAYNLAGGGITQTFTYPVEMRTAPTVAVGTVTYSNASGLVIQGNARQGIMAIAVTANGDAYVTASGSNQITFSAEL
jgi:hypothetical protein